MRRPLIGRWVMRGHFEQTIALTGGPLVLRVPASMRSWTRREIDRVVTDLGPGLTCTITFEPGALLRRRPR